MGWNPGRIWAGASVVVIGGGPSLSLAQIRQVGLASAQGAVKVVAINDAAYPAWFADLAYAADRPWIEAHGGLPGFRGMKATVSPTKFADWNVLENTGTTGFEPKPGAVRSGGNSAYQVLNLMAHLGAARVALLGIDMCGSHWFGDHAGGIASPRPNFDNRCRDFATLAPFLIERNMIVCNCSPGSRLTVFPKAELAQTLRRFVDEERRGEARSA